MVAPSKAGHFSGGCLGASSRSAVGSSVFGGRFRRTSRVLLGARRLLSRTAANDCNHARGNASITAEFIVPEDVPATPALHIRLFLFSETASRYSTITFHRARRSPPSTCLSVRLVVTLGQTMVGCHNWSILSDRSPLWSTVADFDPASNLNSP